MVGPIFFSLITWPSLSSATLKYEKMLTVRCISARTTYQACIFLGNFVERPESKAEMATDYFLYLRRYEMLINFTPLWSQTELRVNWEVAIGRGRMLTNTLSSYLGLFQYFTHCYMQGHIKATCAGRTETTASAKHLTLPADDKILGAPFSWRQLQLKPEGGAGRYFLSA